MIQEEPNTELGQKNEGFKNNFVKIEIIVNIIYLKLLK